MLAMRNVSKTFGNKTVLNDVSFQVNPGEFVCVFGASGSGKTTLLSLLLGMTKPSTGTVEVDGADLKSVPPEALQMYRRRVGVVFQDGKLLPYATVRENIAFPLEIWGAPEGWMQKRIDELLTLMRLQEQGDAFPNGLSAGERCKVGLARAMAAKPLILLCDEPTGTLDPAESTAVIRMLKHLNKQGTTVILCTHDQALVDLLGVRVIRLENGAMSGDASAKDPGSLNERHEIFSEEHPVESMPEVDVDMGPIQAARPAPAVPHETMAEPAVEPEHEHVEQADGKIGISEEIPQKHAVKHRAEPHKRGKRKVHITSINS